MAEHTTQTGAATDGKAWWLCTCGEGGTDLNNEGLAKAAARLHSAKAK